MTASGVTIRPETEADAAGIGNVLAQAFRGADEAQLVDRLRRDGDIVTGLVAELEAGIAGYVALARLVVETSGGRGAAVGLAPLAVRPDLQGRRIGSELARAALDRAHARGEKLAFVLGDPHYYRRFGFTLAEGFRSPYAGPHFMMCALGAAPATGIVRYPRAFHALTA